MLSLVIKIPLLLTHAVLTYHIVRDLIIQRREKQAFRGKKPSSKDIVAWRKIQDEDKILKWFVISIASLDALLLIMVLSENPIYLFLELALAYSILFVFAYLFHTFKKPEGFSLKPITQSGDLKSLSEGQTVSLFDTWMLRTMNMLPTDIAHKVRSAQINPQQKVLQVNLHTEETSEQLLVDRQRQLRFYQSIVDFLVYLVSEEWLGQYQKFFQSIELEVWSDRYDEMGTAIPYLLYHLSARSSKVLEITEKSCDVFKLDRIFQVKVSLTL